MASRRKPIPRTKTPSGFTITSPLSNRYSNPDTNSTYDTPASTVDQQYPQNGLSYDPADPFTTISSAVEGYSNTEVQTFLQPPDATYKPYQPGQYLEPIITGQTLQLSSGPSSSTGRTVIDPFADTASLPATHTPAPGPVSPVGFYNHSTHSYVAYPQDLPAGTEVDHFYYDTEAYASGLQSGATYHPPRSRSPTPAVDDEDYYVVGNESVHFVSCPTNDQDGDSEKASLQQDYGDKHGRYYSEKGYLPTGQPVVFDPEPETPTSTLYTLPPETPLETRHFGPAPTGRAVRRHQTSRRVQLTNGNLILDLEVPPKLVLPWRGNPEMSQTRYTAVTCDPDDFEKKGFFLRQNESGRRTELFIVITMYNEDEVLFCRTMYGVMRNISHLCTRKNSRTWGPNAWEKVVVCIVADGRKKIHRRVLDCLTLLGVYQPGDHMKRSVNGKEVTAHLFEYTTSFAIDPNLHFKYPDKGIVPTQIIFCLKEKNQKKINSHRWFFNAFAPMLQPNVCVLIDVGTRPGSTSLYKLWKTFDVNSNVAGACGEIAAYKGKNWSELLNPLVAAQNFEYKVSCILDKPTESIFGYISVLPGAFSAYRYIALQNDETGMGPLASYFKGEVLHGRDTDIFTSNMYLAEDRILCFELVAKANSNWVLKYVKGAVGETDVPDALPEFISQRRRWLNGSFFAATYAIAHVGQILRSGHSFSRKTVLTIETIYNVINLIFSWFGLGNYYIFFVILTTSLEDPSFGLTGINYFNGFTQFVMATIIVSCFLFSMGNKPAAAKLKYKTIAIAMSILMVYMVVASIICAIQAVRQGGTTNSVMLFSILITFGLYAFSSLLAFDPWHIITSFIPYMLLSPMYINMLSIYAFSNLDDISWGTKQDDIPDTDLGAVVQDSQSHVDVEMPTEAADMDSIYEESLANLRDRIPVYHDKEKKVTQSIAEKEQAAKVYYTNVKTNVLLAWVLSNGMLIFIILSGLHVEDAFGKDIGLTKIKGYLVFVLAFTAITNCVRFAGSTLYLVARLITG